jgi:hypothetical protein
LILLIDRGGIDIIQHDHTIIDETKSKVGASGIGHSWWRSQRGRVNQSSRRRPELRTQDCDSSILQGPAILGWVVSQRRRHRQSTIRPKSGCGVAPSAHWSCSIHGGRRDRIPAPQSPSVHAPSHASLPDRPQSTSLMQGTRIPFTERFFQTSTRSTPRSASGPPKRESQGPR